jgi:aminoglycoside phosphotransferase (APT) family kinase protein
MNPIRKLFGPEYVENLFNSSVLPLYPAFSRISGIKIIPHKEFVWITTYHVVIEFKTEFEDSKGAKTILPIFATAHSGEPRENVYNNLKYLYAHSYSKGKLTVPRPLFYYEELRASFYRGVQGESLKRYIDKNDADSVEFIVSLSAQWLAKLHNLPAGGDSPLVRGNSRIEAAVPGLAKALEKIKRNVPDKYDDFKKIYEKLIRDENKFLDSGEKRWPIHGDAHPENIILVGKDKIAFIDFTDMCLGDFARDLGSFLQQFDYMSIRKLEDKNTIDKMKDLFLSVYFKNSKIEPSEKIKERIETYYNWSALRTAIYYSIRQHPKPERAIPLLKELHEKMGV